MTTILVTGSAATVAVACLPFLAMPAPKSWPFIAASSGLQLVYFLLLAQTYRIADMSVAYPVMRGAAPLLVAISSSFMPGRALTPQTWLGIGLICMGIVGMALRQRRGSGIGTALALLNAVAIASYTLVDGEGVRRSGATAAYTLWIFLFTGVPLVAWASLRRKAALARCFRLHWRAGAMGGCGTVASYGLALWAMTLAPVAVVAALRETSILFAVAISALWLRERVGRARIAAACLVAAGALVLRVA
ncbi:MAG: EamA family transporter [Burkholderiaceae bacterium]